MKMITADDTLALTADRPIRPNLRNDQNLTRDEGTFAGAWIVPSVLGGAALWVWGLTSLFV